MQCDYNRKPGIREGLAGKDWWTSAPESTQSEYTMLGAPDVANQALPQGLHKTTVSHGA